MNTASNFLTARQKGSIVRSFSPDFTQVTDVEIETANGIRYAVTENERRNLVREFGPFAYWPDWQVVFFVSDDAHEKMCAKNIMPEHFSS